MGLIDFITSIFGFIGKPICTVFSYLLGIRPSFVVGIPANLISRTSATWLSATESIMIRLPFSSSDFLSLLTPVKSMVSLKALSARFGSLELEELLLVEEQPERINKHASIDETRIINLFFILYLLFSILMIFSFFQYSKATG